MKKLLFLLPLIFFVFAGAQNKSFTTIKAEYHKAANDLWKDMKASGKTNQDISVMLRGMSDTTNQFKRIWKGVSALWRLSFEIKQSKEYATFLASKKCRDQKLVSMQSSIVLCQMDNLCTLNAVTVYALTVLECK